MTKKRVKKGDIDNETSQISSVSSSISQEFRTTTSEEENDTDFDLTPTTKVQTILTHRKDNGEIKYFVKFSNRPYRDCRWISEDEVRLTNSILLVKYQKKYGNDPPQPPYYDKSYEIPEKIITSRRNDNGVTEYLVKWTNLDYDQNTWETAQRISCPELIKIYEDSNKLPSLEYRFIPPHPDPNSFKPITRYKQSKSGFQMRPYQLQGLNFLLNSWYKQKNSILADEMGLGKTVQAVSFLDTLYEQQKIHGPFLIVGPLSTLPHWEREIADWSDMSFITFYGRKIKRKLMKQFEFFYEGTSHPKFTILLTTYEYTMKESELLSKIKWRCIVIDEAHRLKNHESKLFNTMKNFSTDSKILLTGTPLQNNTEELWTLLNFLDPISFKDLNDFQTKFGELNESDQIIELQTILKPLMLRRLKSDVEKSISPLEEIIIECPMTQHQKIYYKSIYNKNLDYLTRGAHKNNSTNLRNISMELRKVCNHPYLIQGSEDQILIELKEASHITDDDELPENFIEEALIRSAGKMILLDKLLSKLKKDGHRVLIFSQMTRMLDIIQDYLVYKNYNFERLDGSIRAELRQESIDKFNAPESEDFVFLLCTKAGGLGINLTTADTVIIYDSDWNPQNDIQATARCHRIGQKKDVKVYRFITSNSYEQKMFDRASIKLGLDHAVLEGNRTDKNKKKKDKAEEMEKLLRFGAYYAFEEKDNDNTEKFTEEDIESILSKSLTIKHDNIFGGEGSTFSKAQFEINEDVSQVDLTDPDFWNKYKPLIVEDDTSMDSYSIGERRRKLREQNDGKLNEYSDEEIDISEDKSKVKWTKNKINILQNNLLKYGFGRWHIIYETMNLNCPLTEIKIASLAIIKWLLESSPDKFPVIQSIYQQNMKIDEIAKDVKRFLRNNRKEFATLIKNGSTWKLGRLDCLHFLNTLITTCKKPPEELPIPDVQTMKPSYWWSKKDDQILLYESWKYGYSQFQDMKFTQESETPLQSKILIVRLKSLVNGLKSSYVRFKEVQHVDIPFSCETLELALSSWNKKEHKLIIHALLNIGYPSAEKIKEICDINKKTEVIDNYVQEIINYCEDVKNNNVENNNNKIVGQITSGTATKLLSRIQLFEQVRKNLDNDKYSNEDLELFKYVAENGFLDLQNNQMINNRFGNDGLEGKVARTIRDLLLGHKKRNVGVHKHISIYDVPEYPMNEDGSPKLPILIGQTLNIINLGTIVTDRDGFHSERYLYPAGFETEHIYYSCKNPSVKVWYRSLIIDNGGKYPIFRVEMKDNPKVFAEGNAPSTPWLIIVKKVEDKKKKLGGEGNRSLTISGPEYFGLTAPLVVYLLQNLPGVNLCSKYMKRNFGGDNDDVSDSDDIDDDDSSPPPKRISRRYTNRSPNGSEVLLVPPPTRKSGRLHKPKDKLVIDFDALFADQNLLKSDERNLKVKIQKDEVLQRDSLDIFVPQNDDEMEIAIDTMKRKIFNK
ncbi:F/Y-rich N-terminus family protein [Histomonas meleagridis]|nr:F/Y-rich N-terminus family protein [Histomonas meleagridis]